MFLDWQMRQAYPLHSSRHNTESTTRPKEFLHMTAQSNRASMTDYPILILPDDFLERDLYEMPLKGRLSCGIVERASGARYRLSFTDPVRLRQDLESDAQRGRPWFVEPNLIVLTEVTLENIKRCIHALEREGYFDKIQPERTA